MVQGARVSMIEGKMRIKSFLIIIFLISICLPVHADVWADFHGTTSTAGIDTGSRYNPYSNLKPPLVLLWSKTNWDGWDASGNTNNVIQESSPAVVNGIVYITSANGTKAAEPRPVRL